MNLMEFYDKNGIETRKEFESYLRKRFGDKKIGKHNTFQLSLAKRTQQQLGHKYTKIYCELLECSEEELPSLLYVSRNGVIRSIKSGLVSMLNRLSLIRNDKLKDNIRLATKHLKIILKCLEGEKNGTVNS